MKQLVSEGIYKIRSGSEITYLNSHSIDIDNWEGYPAKVKAAFSIANDDKNIYLRFEVSESNVQAKYLNINDPVYKDSCVEFFISFDGEYYYNFEFNCIGNVLAAYGKDRNQRKFLDEDVLRSLRIESSLGKNKIKVIDRQIEWKLGVEISLGVFQYTKLDRFSGLKAYCNFYKCGDDLPEPHYLSWSPVISDKPDFHKPECFGELIFSD